MGEIEFKDLIVTEFQVKREFDDMSTVLGVTFHRMNSPFYDGERWSVRFGGNCLNTDSEWEYEPRPSIRDDAFYQRCRFGSIADALMAYNNQDERGA